MTSWTLVIDPIGLEDWKRVVPYRTIDQWYQGELKVTPEQQKQYQMESYYHGEWKPEYEGWCPRGLAAIYVKIF